MDARTKAIRERETGIGEHSHNVRQLIRVGIGVVSSSICIISQNFAGSDAMASLMSFGGFAIAVLLPFRFEWVSEKRTNDTMAGLLRKTSECKDKGFPVREKLISDIAHLQNQKRTGSFTALEIECIVDPDTNPNFTFTLRFAPWLMSG